ncbi:MAG: DUF2069 domain-containing protein [Acidiferrobacterales bacterium]
MQIQRSPDSSVATSARTRTLYAGALGAYLALIALSVLWEGWLAPAANAPPGLWLTLKSLPLLLPLFGLLHGKPYTYAWASMLVLAYLAEGVVLAYTYRAEPLSLHNVFTCALMETALCLVFVLCAPFYARLRAIELQKTAAE